MRGLVTAINVGNLMAFIPIPNVVQLNLEHKLFDQDVVNTTYWLNASPWTVTDMIDLVSANISMWTTEIMPLLSQDLTFENVKSRDLTVQIGLSYEAAVNPIVAGGIATAGLPGNVALCVKKTTGYSGPNARGRIYLAGMGEGFVIGNEVTSSFLANILAALADWQSGVESLLSGVTHVHVSRYLNGVPRTVGAYWNVLTFTGDTILDSQRRRLTGRGS